MPEYAVHKPGQWRAEFAAAGRSEQKQNALRFDVQRRTTAAKDFTAFDMRVGYNCTLDLSNWIEAGHPVPRRSSTTSSWPSPPKTQIRPRMTSARSLATTEQATAGLT